jgi:hypothetical protein
VTPTSWQALLLAAWCLAHWASCWHHRWGLYDTDEIVQTAAADQHSRITDLDCYVGQCCQAGHHARSHAGSLSTDPKVATSIATAGFHDPVCCKCLLAVYPCVYLPSTPACLSALVLPLQISKTLLNEDARLRLPRFLEDETPKDPEATKQVRLLWRNHHNSRATVACGSTR